MTKLIYFDCPTGLSGDMILAALIDCGADQSYIRDKLSDLHLPPWQINCVSVQKNGLAARQMEISYETDHHGHGRHLSEIVALIEAAQFPVRAAKRAVATFQLLAQAEAAVHGSDPEHVHFHEVGATDAIIDICGAALALDYLDIEAVYASALPLSHGTVTCAHGQLPTPAPAVLQLLSGAALYQSELTGELITPTGAAILMSSLAPDGFNAPQFTLLRSGRGAGQRELPVANILRALLGETQTEKQDSVDVVTCWLDDENPEVLGHLWQTISADPQFLDMAYAPIYMKKGRPAWQLTILSTAGSGETSARIILKETSALGVRIFRQNRLILARKTVTVSTIYGTIEIKVGGEGANIAPEYSSCAQAAATHQVPLKLVYQTAVTAYMNSKNL